MAQDQQANNKRNLNMKESAQSFPRLILKLFLEKSIEHFLCNPGDKENATNKPIQAKI